MRTELRIEGANCSHCLNEVIDRLRSLEGVRSVDTSIVGGCLAVEHDDLATAQLLDVLRDGLHGVELATNEIVMAPVEPVVTVLACHHADHADG